jgi:hypothetical protein
MKDRIVASWIVLAILWDYYVVRTAKVLLWHLGQETVRRVTAWRFA